MSGRNKMFTTLQSVCGSNSMCIGDFSKGRLTVVPLVNRPSVLCVHKSAFVS